MGSTRRSTKPEKWAQLPLIQHQQDEVRITLEVTLSPMSGLALVTTTLALWPQDEQMAVWVDPWVPIKKARSEGGTRYRMMHDAALDFLLPF